MTIWRIAIDANSDNATYDELKDRGVIAIGWRDIGDLTSFVGKQRVDIEKHVVATGDQVYAATSTDTNDWWWGDGGNRGHRRNIGRIFDCFLNCIKPGDLVVGFEGLTPMGITEFCPTSQYVYDPKYEYAHCWDGIQWVDANSIGFSRRGTMFLGITRNPAIKEEVVRLWGEYKQRINSATAKE